MGTRGITTLALLAALAAWAAGSSAHGQGTRASVTPTRNEGAGPASPAAAADSAMPRSPPPTTLSPLGPSPAEAPEGPQPFVAAPPVARGRLHQPPATTTGPTFGLGFQGGMTVNDTQGVGGIHVEVRHLALPGLEVQFSGLAGAGEKYASVRGLLQVRYAVHIDGLRLYPIFGGEVYYHWAINQWAKGCTSTYICHGTAGAFDFGAGAAFRWFGIDAFFSSSLNETPLLTILGHVTLVL